MKNNPTDFTKFVTIYRDNKKVVSIAEPIFKKTGMITIDEFWQLKEKLAIHCDKLWKAGVLLTVLGKLQRKDNRKDSSLSLLEDYQIFDGEDSCYDNFGNNGNILDYKYDGYKIYAFEVIELSKDLSLENKKRLFECLRDEEDQDNSEDDLQM